MRRSTLKVRPGSGIRAWHSGHRIEGVLIAIFGDARVVQKPEYRPTVPRLGGVRLACGYCFSEVSHPLVCVLLRGSARPIIDCHGILDSSSAEMPMYSHEQEEP